MKEKLIELINEIMRNNGYVTLSKKCGKYYGLFHDEGVTYCNIFVGDSRYDTQPIEELDAKALDLIYTDLKEDF